MDYETTMCLAAEITGQLHVSTVAVVAALLWADPKGNPYGDFKEAVSEAKELVRLAEGKVV